MKMLVVEDNSNDALLLRLALKRKTLGPPVAVVDGAAEAIDYLLGHNGYGERRRFPLPELILLDWKLPGMQGWEFLEWLRAQPRYRALPVTVMSGSEDAIEMQKAYEYGANFWVGKPQSMKELAAVVQKIHAFWADTTSLPPVIAHNYPSFPAAR
ncbi:response regulator [Pedosphaera parvula]|uniref:Response regulator receiver protein n=1 Tax=Pedosphaera parvula (strain Ellin514) TaxID=320771 RepID=B9XFA6_PEDPL|nr:response regulator [Pedosphaera parvula]EEF61604.1 response regulator receiver protein [Pedosphaera parvula Ellin514]